MLFRSIKHRVIATNIIQDILELAKLIHEMRLMFVAKLLEEFVVLYRAISVEDEAVDCAVRYPRTHHPHHSSPSGTEYLPGDTNLRRVTFRSEAPSYGLTRAGE